MKKTLIIILAMVLTFSQTVSASSQIYDPTFFNLNGINYYDGMEECIATTSSTSLSGNTNAEKIWNFFKSKGFTDEQAAGFIGNLSAETGGTFDPKIVQNGGAGPAAGIVQWENYTNKSDRWLNLDNFAKSKGKNWDELDVQLDFIIHELEGSEKNAYEDLKSYSNTFEEATIAIERSYERSCDWCKFFGNFGSPSQKTLNTYNNSKSQLPGIQKRLDAAADAYESFKGSGSSSTSTPSSQNDGAFTFIGDSITAGMRDKLTQSFPKSAVNAFIGRKIASPGQSGDSVLDFISKNSSSLNSVVINIGTNDNFPIEDAKKMLDLLKGKKIYLVNNFGLGGNANFEKINQNIQEAISGNSYVTVLDWKSYVEPKGGREKFYAADGYHLNEEGQKLYIEFLTEQLNGKGNNTSSTNCGSSLSGGNNASISDRAIELAWSEADQSRSYRFDISDKQREALKKTGLINNDEQWVQKGASCDAFVSMVMSTTVDPEFVKHCCGVASLRDYMAKTSDKYEKIPWEGGKNLKPGDIMTAGRGGGPNAHIQIYVEIGGEGKIANAGWSRTTGVIEPLNFKVMENLGEVEVWRWKG